jgi:muramoyltetrapeptide carboxypeptidase LdcA involved in peptidoglycan recycling
MFEQFTQAGVFAGAKAIVLGRFELADSKDRRQLWSDVVARFASSTGLPVYSGLPVGHDPRVQMTLPLGTFAEISGAQLVVRSPCFRQS